MTAADVRRHTSTHLRTPGNPPSRPAASQILPLSDAAENPDGYAPGHRIDQIAKIPDIIARLPTIKMITQLRIQSLGSEYSPRRIRFRQRLHKKSHRLLFVPGHRERCAPARSDASGGSCLRSPQRNTSSPPPVPRIPPPARSQNRRSAD